MNHDTTSLSMVTFHTQSHVAPPLISAMLTQLSAARFFSCKQKGGRLLLNTLLKFLPATCERLLVSCLKKKASRNVYIPPSAFSVSRALMKNSLIIEPHYPLQKTMYLGLTFDIDYKQDYDLLPYFLDDLVKRHIPATINLVTHADYPISSAFIRDMQQSGFEIGLHGDTHNTALAFLPKAIIRRKLQRAIDRLGFVPFGFRSPGLSYSRKLVEVLDELEFQYDSSLTTGIAMYTSLEFPYIFQHPGLNLVEVPLFMQDYNFFVNNLYSEKEAIAVFTKQLAEMSQIHGIALLNIHPIISFERRDFWHALLHLIESYQETACVTSIHHLLTQGQDDESAY